MNAIYFAISPYDQINLSLGFSMAHDLFMAGYELPNLHYEEVNLVHTGWASNSFHLFIVANSQGEANTFIQFVHSTFNQLLKETYDVSDVNQIDFDDETFEEEFKALFTLIKSKYPVLNEINSYYQIEV